MPLFYANRSNGLMLLTNVLFFFFFHFFLSNRFKSFSYLYDEDQFIASLKNDIVVVKSLPDNLKAARKRNEFKTFRPKNSASPNYYIKEVLPTLKKAKVVGLILADGGCLQVAGASLLPIYTLTITKSSFLRKHTYSINRSPHSSLHYKESFQMMKRIDEKSVT
jgi:hypothetical protein